MDDASNLLIQFIQIVRMLIAWLVPPVSVLHVGQAIQSVILEVVGSVQLTATTVLPVQLDVLLASKERVSVLSYL